MSEYNFEPPLMVSQAEDKGNTSSLMNVRNQSDEKEVFPAIAHDAGYSISTRRRMQHYEPSIAAHHEGPLPRRQQIQLIDYTQNRNPRYTRDTSFERVQVFPKDSFAGNRSDCRERVSELSDRKLSSIPGRQSIDTGSFLFEKRPHSSEERIEFMFKVPQKQARKSSREDLLATLYPRSSMPRQREHLARMFNSIPNKISRRHVPQRNHSAPDCLQTQPDSHS